MTLGATFAAAPFGTQRFGASSYGQKLTLTLSASAGLHDSLTPAAAHKLTLADSAGLHDSTSRVVFRRVTLTDSMGLHDTTSCVAFHRITFTDSAGLYDTTSRAWTYCRTLTDTAGIHDGLAFGVRKTLNDTLTLADTLAVRFSLHLADSSGLADTHTTAADYRRSLTDNASLHDGVTTAAAYQATLDDHLTLADSWAKDIGTSLADGFRIADALDIRLKGRLYLPADRFTLTDTLTTAAQFHLTLDDSTGLHDQLTHAARFVLRLADLLPLHDTTHGQLGRILTDRMHLSDHTFPAATFNRIVTDLLRLADAHRFAVRHVETDLAGVSDLGVHGTFLRTLLDAAHLSDAHAFDMTRHLASDTGIGDTLTTAAQFHVSRDDDTGLTGGRPVFAVHILKSDSTDLHDTMPDPALYMNRGYRDVFTLDDTLTTAAQFHVVIDDSTGLTENGGYSTATDRDRLAVSGQNPLIPAFETVMVSVSGGLTVTPTELTTIMG